MQYSRHFLPDWLLSNILFIDVNETQTRHSPVLAACASFAQISEVSSTCTSLMTFLSRYLWRDFQKRLSVTNFDVASLSHLMRKHR